MAEKQPQSFANHAKFVPPYHFFLSIALFIVALWRLWQLISTPSIDTAVNLLLAVCFIGILLYARVFPLAAQDRVIRLEETIRMQRLLPADQHGRITELRRGQFVALRFASDDELPELFRRVVDGELRQPKEIKQAIRHWRADYFRL